MHVLVLQSDDEFTEIDIVYHHGFSSDWIFH